MKLSEVNKVQNMLISMWTNAVMFRVNVQNVLCRVQRRLSVACAIHWSRCQSLRGPDGPIPPRHDGTALPRPWSIGGCTHSCRIPHTAQSMGFRSDCSAAMSLIISGLQAMHGRLLPEQRSTLPVASILLSAVLTLFNTVFIQKHLSSFVVPESFCCLNTFIACLSSTEKAFYAIFNKKTIA